MGPWLNPQACAVLWAQRDLIADDSPYFLTNSFADRVTVPTLGSD